MKTIKKKKKCTTYINLCSECTLYRVRCGKRHRWGRRGGPPHDVAWSSMAPLLTNAAESGEAGIGGMRVRNGRMKSVKSNSSVTSFTVGYYRARPPKFSDVCRL